jgi:hypothetical protein
MVYARCAAAFHQGDNRAFFVAAALDRLVAVLVVGLWFRRRLALAVLGFIGFHDLAFATDRRSVRCAHGFAQAMENKPGGFPLNHPAQHRIYTVCSFPIGAFPAMSSCPNPAANLEALLRDACRRALALGLSFTNQLRLYRSIVALAREVRLRFGGAMPASSSRTLSALLAAVCERASELGPDPELPLPDAILVQRLAVQLSRAARQAGIAEPAERQFVRQHAMHREEPSEHTLPAQHPMHREKPAQPVAAGAAEPPEQTLLAQNPMHREKPIQPKAPEIAEPPEQTLLAQNPMHREKPIQPKAPEIAEASERTFPAQHPMQREGETDDGRLNAWHRDHKTDRDQRAHEKLRSVLDDRSFTQIKAMNRRDREERETAEQTAAANPDLRLPASESIRFVAPG